MDVDPSMFPRELMTIQRIAIGSSGEAAQPDAIRAAFAEFFSMLIFYFAAEGSGMSNKAP
ncbi:Aquaporin [Arachis hypogaea]|nr:Aquaporin [Arachis hypogaea]